MIQAGRTILLTLAVVATVLGIAFAIAVRVDPFELAFGNLLIRTQQGTTAPLPDDVASFSPAAPPTIAEVDRPRNLVLLIGDGMGIGQVSSTSALVHGMQGGLAFERAPFTGLMKTYAADGLVTDSAASATALATGFKTDRTVVGQRPDGTALRSLFVAAHAAGRAVGMITTSGLVDATPAGFVARAGHRREFGTIFEQMLDSGFELLVGGDYITSTRARRDPRYLELVASLDETASGRFTVARSEPELVAASLPVVGLFPARPGWGHAYGPPLEVSTRKALELLAEDPDGFMLLVECEVTDDSGHANRFDRVVSGVQELDEALQVVLDVTTERGDTLVLVTADHDTGGMGIRRGRYAEKVASVRWATHKHTAQWVPMFAFGPGAELFTGVLDNTDVARRAGALLAVEGFAHD